jgi:ABC-type transport system involved in cytochrome c biogenesis permease component
MLNAPLPLAGVAAGMLGAAGLAALIVTFGVAVVGSERRSGLLTVLLCPTAVPVLLAASQAATPGVDARPWLGLLVAYDLIGIVVAWAVFPVLMEE